MAVFLFLDVIKIICVWRGDTERASPLLSAWIALSSLFSLQKK